MNRGDAETRGLPEAGLNRPCCAPPCPGGERDFLLWQLADSAFPTGSFAHSAGLEAAWQHGEVDGRTDLLAFLETSLRQVARASLPFVTTTHDDPGQLSALDGLCDAFLSNHVANRASRLQGRAFLSAVERIYAPRAAAVIPRPRFAHHAPVFGAGLKQLGVERETAVRLFVFGHLRGLLAAGVRLNLVGPMEAQRLQWQLSGRAEELVRCGGMMTLEDLAQTAPLLDLWQGAQDRLYSRLFQS